MQRFRNILVGIDLSHADRLADVELNPPTLQAIEQAIWLAEMLSAELTFFAAIDLSAHTLELLEDDTQLRTATVETEAHAVLEGLVSQAKARTVAAKAKLAFGNSWVEIIQQVQREKHDLVIVGTRHLGAAERLLLGSTGMKLLRYCPCPVWATKPDPEREVANVLVASDLSDLSHSALELVVNGGQLKDVKIHLLYAMEYHFEHRLLHTGLAREKVDELRIHEKEEALRKLHEQLADTDHRTLAYGVQVHVLDGPADVVILQAIGNFEIDLLVMGTVGRSGISRLLVGNTAERLLPEVTCSVLAIKPNDFECPISLE